MKWQWWLTIACGLLVLAAGVAVQLGGSRGPEAGEFAGASDRGGSLAPATSFASYASASSSVDKRSESDSNGAKDAAARRSADDVEGGDGQEDGSEGPPGNSSGTGSAAAPLFPVHIRRPSGMPRVDTGKRNAAGESVRVACSTCHATREPNPANRASDQLDQFHRGLRIDHGGLSCLTCHDGTNYDRLRLADGTPLPMERVMQLCAQCHGPQYRDYQHGSHGGMAGYWDRSRGPRVRNNCVDCHDAHAPQFPAVLPVFPPVDRFPPVPVHGPHEGRYVDPAKSGGATSHAPGGERE